MNPRVASYQSVLDGDLVLCPANGVAYQRDMQAGRVEYGSAYLEKCRAYEGSEIAGRVNVGRVLFLSSFLPRGSTVLDVGSGTGEFMRTAHAAGFLVRGFDLIPAVAEKLWLESQFSNNPAGFIAVTMWDSMEHMEDPERHWLERMDRGSLLFVSVPVFDSLGCIRQSKHYRPGEHLYYWTAAGLVGWMDACGFSLLGTSAHEEAAGREAVGAFAFIKRYA